MQTLSLFLLLGYARSLHLRADDCPHTPPDKRYHQESSKYYCRSNYFEKATARMKSCPPDGVQAMYRQDGFGAQYTSLMAGYLNAVAQNKTFCVSPFRLLLHWVDPKEAFEFVGGYAYSDYQAIGTAGRDNGSTDTPMIHGQSWEAIGSYPEVAQRIREFYLSTPKPPLIHYNDSEVSFAWHVRRGDVSTHANNARYTSNQQIMDGLINLQRFSGDIMKTVHLFSEGNPEDFDDIVKFCEKQSFNCKVHVENDIWSTYHHMVMADVLVAAQSSLSLGAALINTGKTYNRKCNTRYPEKGCIWMDHSLHRNVAARNLMSMDNGADASSGVAVRLDLAQSQLMLARELEIASQLD